ncbi:hypothetical protein B9479_001320 [Cryptococcus floricola]|uniref:Glycosyl transferase family 1 domain-containing protein n=1 Tax=Cryptococcus floricola TaxID=2591691 RepID=A0A5D3B4R8_9TREE|nr:hypothetical protein B9479_001320 [Cryptococcus floricola]
MYRKLKIAGLILAIFLFVSYHRLRCSISEPSEPPQRRDVKLDFKTEEVWVFEESVHDEVNGAIAVGLQAAEVMPTFACHFRHDFATILSSIVNEEPTVVRPNGPDFHKALAEDSIDNVILTTCFSSLQRHKAAIYASTAHVVCLIHHSSPHVYHELKPLMEPLAEQGRLSIVVLGEHVRERIQADLNIWTENMESTVWESVPVEVMIPIFDYPSSSDRPEPVIFPSRAVIQGNIEPGRRNYEKLLSDLRKSFLKSPAMWGWYGLEGSPLRPLLDSSPFTLHLVGQINQQHPVVIPVELRDVVQIHYDLPYPEFYQLISEADVMVPAFRDRGPYEDTTSSSIAAAVVTRIPVLASARHLLAYTYLKGPSIIQRLISTSEVSALEAIRAQGQPRRRESKEEWKEFQDEIIQDNAEMWGRILKHRSYGGVNGGQK